MSIEKKEETEALLFKQGRSLRHDAEALDDEIAKRMGEVQQASGKKDAVGAMKNFKHWKSNFGQLHDQIAKQLKHSRELRSSRTLLSLYEDTQSEKMRKFVNNVAMLLIGDIKSIMGNFPEARSITLPELSEEELEYLNEQNAADAAKAAAKSDAKYGHKFNTDRKSVRQRQAMSKKLIGDDAVPKSHVTRTEHEIHTRRVNKLLNSIVLPEEGADHLDLFPVIDLMTVRSQLITSAAEKILHEKRDLYESYGVELELESLEQGQSGESREMHVLRDLLCSFRSMLETVSACMLMQSYGPVDSIRRLNVEKEELKQTVDSVRRDIELVQNDLIAEIESHRTGDGSSNGQSTASLLVQLNGEQRRNEALHRDLNGAWEAKAEMEGEIKQLKRALGAANARIGEQRREFEARTQWFDPHVKSLEESVEFTLHSYKKLETDVQLLSILYKDSLKDVEEARRKTREVTEERDLMGRKLSDVIKKLQISKREERRKDMIARKMMMARRTAIDATSEAKCAHDVTAAKETEARETIRELESRLTSAEKAIQRYTEQTRQLEERVHSLTGDNIEMEKRIDRLTQEKIALAKIHASELREFTSRPAQEEVDMELDALRSQLSEMQNANEALQEALANSQLQMN